MYGNELLVARRAALLVCLSLSAGLIGGGPAAAKGALPEDILKGQLIISNSSFPRTWSSPSAYAAKMKNLHKSSLVYDRKTGKLTVYYAAFFAQPVPDVEAKFVIYDISQSPHVKKGSWEAFMGKKGERVLFNSVELDKEDIEMNKKYLFAVEYGRKIIASGQIILRGEGPKYSGKVDFSEEEAKKPPQE